MKKLQIIIIVSLLILPGLYIYSQDNNSAAYYFNNIFTYNGPLLSLLQASIGTYSGLMLTKYLGINLNITNQKDIDQIPLISWSIGSSIVLVGLGAIGLHTGLPAYLYYPIPTAIALIAPKYLFNLSWQEEGIYIVGGTLIGLTTHVLFSLFLGYNNYLPFWKIDPIWSSVHSQNIMLYIPIMKINY